MFSFTIGRRLIFRFDANCRSLQQSCSLPDVAAGADTKDDRPEITTRVEEPSEEVIGAEAKKGYGLLLIGREPTSEGPKFHDQITPSAAQFGGPFASRLREVAIEKTEEAAVSTYYYR